VRTHTAIAATIAGAAFIGAPAAQASYEHLTVSVEKHILHGSRDSVHGQMKPAAKDRVVWIQVRKDGWKEWHMVARPKTSSHGRFHTSWRPRELGHYAVRAVLTGSDAAPRRGGVTVYKTSEASWYGPGFYGHRTACGQTLTPDTLGVANRTLPCGTRVALYYHGHAVTAPVIDRGPYSGNREYDLTAATKRRLHFGSTGTVWSAPGA
jgi:rare lipoprotein A (peptidoglycan hydrolase)